MIGIFSIDSPHNFFIHYLIYVHYLYSFDIHFLLLVFVWRREFVKKVVERTLRLLNAHISSPDERRRTRGRVIPHVIGFRGRRALGTPHGANSMTAKVRSTYAATWCRP